MNPFKEITIDLFNQTSVYGCLIILYVDGWISLRDFMIAKSMLTVRYPATELQELGLKWDHPIGLDRNGDPCFRVVATSNIEKRSLKRDLIHIRFNRITRMARIWEGDI